MGFFSGIFRGIKKAVKGVTKVVKKVVKSISKVGKKIWKGVKGIAKKISKLGPLASIAIGFIPGFQGLWASSGIWGAMAKGAITGFITSGGKVKGALIGAVGGGIGYGLNAGINAYKQGVSTLGENATISEQITAGFKSVGNSTTEGVMNMYKSASDVLSTGDFGKLNYLDSTGQSIYSRTLLDDANAEVAYDKAIGDIGPEIHERASQNYVNNNPSEFGKRMSPTVQRRMMDMSQQGGETGAISQAKAFGYNSDVGKAFYKDYTSTLQGTPGSATYQRQMSEIYDYADATNTGLEQSRDLWEQTGGANKSTSFDWSGGGTEPYKYTADGLRATRSSGAGGTPTYISPQEATAEKESNQSKNISDAISSLAGSDTTPVGLPFSTGDTGDQYDVAGGLKSAGGTGGVGLNYADYYGGMAKPVDVAHSANLKLQSLLAQYASR
jgi:hypothetical protein